MQNDFIDSKIQMHSDDILLMDCPSQAENFTFLAMKYVENNMFNEFPKLFQNYFKKFE